MTTEAEPKTSGRGGARGPRVFKETPTARDRVIGDSLAAKVKELTNRDVSLLDTLAVKFSLSRWYEDPATKDLLGNMDDQLKKANAQAKKEKAQKALDEAEAELEDLGGEEDSEDGSEDEATAAAAEDSDGEEEEDVDVDDPFDDDEKVSASF
jgi:hypothetical protein